MPLASMTFQERVSLGGIPAWCAEGSGGVCLDGVRMRGFWLERGESFIVCTW